MKKIASFVSAIITSAAPFAFADASRPDAGVPTVDYHYGMNLDIDKVISRTDNSSQQGVVPSILVYRDSQGEVHKVRFLEWGGKSSQQ
ncbi:DUF2790 domain-containing protein [Pseudomonas sp. LRF_L74]|uniref:DUF2790 domain-containing protein n=1 Tax=Pseudomonas sp. LRF_L74 TaxID=3369422 RepID=UPI003F6197CE